MAQDDARVWGNRIDSSGEEVFMDALNVLAVTPEMEAEANETTSSQEAQEEMQRLSALEDLRKRYAYYRKKISSQREKRHTTFDTKRIFYLKFRISSSAFRFFSYICINISTVKNLKNL